MARKSLPMYFRAYGFPCAIDAGPEHNEKVDNTWMSEDVDLITEFLVQRDAKMGMERKDLSEEHQKLQEGNPYFPASATFDTYPEIEATIPESLDFKVTGPRLLLAVDKQQNNNSKLQIFTDNCIVFLYLTGHGMSQTLAQKLGKLEEDDSVKLELPKYTKYPVVQKSTYDKRKQLKGGEILAYKSFLSLNDFYSEFFLGMQMEEIKNLHLIIVADSCHSGHWERFSKTDAIIFDPDADLSITVQTASEMDTPSHGYYFTPLFINFQNLQQQELDILEDKFKSLTAKERDQLLKDVPVQQFPTFTHGRTDVSLISKNNRRPEEGNHFRIIDPSTELAGKLYLTIHKLRFFVDKWFFAFFAKLYYNENWLGIDVSSLTRPILRGSNAKSFIKNLIKERRKKLVIKGMKLTMYDDDGRLAVPTPACIVALKSKHDFADKAGPEKEHECWYQLHVHYDGQNEFPGEITHLKVYYAKYCCVNNKERAKGFTEGSCDDLNDVNEVKAEAGKPVNNGGKHPHQTDYYLEGWQEYKESIRTTLEQWGRNQIKEMQMDSNRVVELPINAWQDKTQWKKEDSVQLGNIVAVRKCRFLLT
ncbi:hypothetical protein I4U23_027383 [Adineta vaga]|nr:hypothetical protein I4U23_027383 [Adineta vaga]